jgi:uncharacterized membrane protein
VGARFWFGLFGTLVVGAIIVSIIFLLIGAAFVSWGFLGTLLVIGLVALAAGWFVDRRQ